MECYDIILKMYRDNESVDEPSRVLDVKTSKCLINLMKKLDKTEDKTNVKNCIILLINLFFDIEFPDHYHTKGKDLESLSAREKESLYKMLKAEFLS